MLFCTKYFISTSDYYKHWTWAISYGSLVQNISSVCGWFSVCNMICLCLKCTKMDIYYSGLYFLFSLTHILCCGLGLYPSRTAYWFLKWGEQNSAHTRTHTHTHTFFFIPIQPILHFPLPFSLPPPLSEFSQPFTIFFTIFSLSFLAFPFSLFNGAKAQKLSHG